MQIRRRSIWILALLTVCGTVFRSMAAECMAAERMATEYMAAEYMAAECMAAERMAAEYMAAGHTDLPKKEPAGAETVPQKQEEAASQKPEEAASRKPGETGSQETESSEAPVYPQLTAEDIVRLDEGDAELIYDEDGRVTFIRGRYSPEKVENYEDAVESLNYVATLLGLTNGALFFCVYAGVDYTTGYTYYLFLQRDGDVTVVNASIKIYVDPEGYTAALSCSFRPSTGVREETAGRITAKEAEQIVRETWPGLTVYPDATRQAGVMQNEQNIHVWSVFSDNPGLRTGDSDLPYLQHFVSYNGDYLMNLPCATMKEPLLERNDALERRARAMFDGYEKEIWKGEVTLHDGSRKALEVPVARSPEDGRYYLMDLDRKILVADYPEAVYGSGDLLISSSDSNGGWNEKELLAMYNIGRVYDYYADHGLYSVDGSGIPIAILSGVCEADGTPVDNAFFNGFRDGFGVFAISDINNSVECLDIMGHEFTHGISSYSMGGSSYVNEQGAINEAFSDIMGNLCELTYGINDRSIAEGKTTEQFALTGLSLRGSSGDPDPKTGDWRIGETGGKVYRDMSNPVAYRQPAFAGDAYYCLPTRHSNASGNDYGGVHENSSLLGSIAWVMNEHGLSYEEQYSLWMTAMNMMTPASDYDDILQAMIFARKSYGWEDEIDTWLEEAFAERGLLEHSHSWSRTWDGVTFARYNAEYLKRGSVNDQEENKTETEDAGGGLAAFLTGGADKDTGNLEPDHLQEKRESPARNTEAYKEAAKEAAKEGNDDRKWLAGVGLDRDGRITREGFGRIDLDTAAEDREILVGAAVMNPYTWETVSVNCPDEKGHISFLVPEGSYWFSLCIGRGGPSQTEYMPYTKAGVYGKMDAYTMFGEVEVKAGESTVLPFADVP